MSLLFCLYAISELFLAIVSGSEPVVLRCHLPERAEILKGLLDADFIAFHTYDYMRHFISAVKRVLRIDFKLDEAQLGNRVVETDALPMGINYGLYHNASSSPEVRRAIVKAFCTVYFFRF